MKKKKKFGMLYFIFDNIVNIEIEILVFLILFDLYMVFICC